MINVCAADTILDPQKNFPGCAYEAKTFPETQSLSAAKKIMHNKQCKMQSAAITCVT